MEPIDAFSYLVRKDGCTLFDVAAETGYFLDDIIALNPTVENVASMELQPGTVIQLPVSLRFRGMVASSSFVIRTIEHRLQRIDLAMTERARWCPSLTLPERSVFSKAERILSVASAEADRQLDGIKSSLQNMEKPTDKAVRKQVHHFVDVSAIQSAQADAEEAFSSRAVPLHSYREDNQNVFSNLSHSTLSESGLSSCGAVPIERTGCTGSCVEHTHQWEFTFCRPKGFEDQERWAVLSCQPLTCLMSAIRCRFRELLSHLDAAFFFIGGTFYVHGDVDLSEVIRHFNPVGGQFRSNASYGRCPTMSADQTTFGDLQIRAGEMCVFRHLGNCDHYFYFTGVSKLGSLSPDPTRYPRLLLKRKELVIRCSLCKHLPSTVAVYLKSADSLTGIPASAPQYCCDICYERFAAEIDSSSKFLKIVPSVDGEYFTS